MGSELSIKQVNNHLVRIILSPEVRSLHILGNSKNLSMAVRHQQYSKEVKHMVSTHQNVKF